MRNLIIILLCAVSCTASAVGIRGIDPRTDITTDLWHFWNPAVGGTNDLGSKPQNVVLNGGLTNSVDGWDVGTDDNKYATITGAISNGWTFTLSCWIKPNLTAMDSNASGGWWWSDSGAAFTEIDSRMYYVKNEAMRFVVACSTGNYPSVRISSNAVNNAWIMVTAVRSSTAITTYTNGVQSFTAPAGLTNNNVGAVTTIGAPSWDPVAPATKFHGVIDKFRFYGAAKDATVIRAIYDTEKVGKGL